MTNKCRENPEDVPVDDGEDAPVDNAEDGYVNYFEILGLNETAKPGEVHKAYRRHMKDLVHEIGRVEITEERRSHYLLEMAKLNAAVVLLREPETRDNYWAERQRMIELEQEWRSEAAASGEDCDALRGVFEGRMRDFLAKYVEELVLDAGRDKECVEASHWNAAHERHAFRILRLYRQGLYRKVLERLPFYQTTPPKIDWAERNHMVASVLTDGPAPNSTRRATESEEDGGA